LGPAAVLDTGSRGAKKKPAGAGLKAGERRTLRTAYAVRSTKKRIARPFLSLCDWDHEKAVFTGPELRRVRLETYPPGCLVGAALNQALENSYRAKVFL